jgi:hypothetical protein
MNEVGDINRTTRLNFKKLVEDLFRGGGRGRCGCCEGWKRRNGKVGVGRSVAISSGVAVASVVAVGSMEEVTVT